jgi:exopolysaccharide production protein ExoQ
MNPDQNLDQLSTSPGLFSRIFRAVEPWLVGFYLLYFLGFNLPPNLVALLNISSYAVIGVLVLGCWKRVLYAATRDWPLLLLHLLAFVSVWWSAAPSFTEIESKTFVRAAIFGFYLAVRFGLKGQMRLLSYILGFSMIGSLIAGAVFPSYGVHFDGIYLGAWKGLFTFKNLFASVSSIAALIFLLFALEYKQQRWLNLLMFGLTFMLLVLSQGRTALLTFGIAVGLLPLRQVVQQSYRMKAIVIAGTLLASFGCVALVLSNIQFILVDVFGKNLEFNGRMPIWTLMLEAGSKQPWLGHGVAGFWTSDAATYVLRHTWAAVAEQAGARFNAHNGYIDLFLQLGVIGLGLYLVSFVTVFSRTVYLLFKAPTIEVFWVLQMLVFFALISLADSLSVGTANGQWSLYVGFTSAIAIEYQRFRTQATQPLVDLPAGDLEINPN